jgi:hypothetical protein
MIFAIALLHFWFYVPPVEPPRERDLGDIYVAHWSYVLFDFELQGYPHRISCMTPEGAKNGGNLRCQDEHGRSAVLPIRCTPKGCQIIEGRKQK